MGTYDVKFHAYEQAIKKDPAWAKMTKKQRSEQLGRYSLGLQFDADKAAKKAAGKAFAKELAMERKDKIKMYEGLFDQIADHEEKQKMYEKLWKELDEIQKKPGNKFLDFLKNNKKALLIGAGVLAAVGVGTWLWNKFNNDKAEEAAKAESKVNNEEQATDTTKVVPGVVPGIVADSTATDSTKVVPGVVPGIVADSTATDSTKVVPGVVPGIVADSTAIDSTKVVPGIVPGIVADSTATDSTKVVPGVVPDVPDPTKVTPTAPEKVEDKVEETEKAENTEKAEKAEDTSETIKTPVGEYKVKKGDNIWNIAKKQLADELGRKPLNREICKRRDKIMALNPELKYEADNYTVLIYPKQTIKIAG